MSDLARLLQQYGYGLPPASPQGETVSTSNVLADALRVAGVPKKDEHGFLFSNVGGELKFNPWESVKGFMSYKAPPGALSTSGDDAPVRNSAEAAGWLGLSGLGLNFAGQVPKNALGIFGGRLAKTADHAALAAAEKMDAAGVGRRTIWDATGWFKGTDGKWRFEIDDSKASLLPDAHTIPEKQSVPVQQALSHPELFEAYPQLADYKYQHRPLPWPEVPGAHSGDHKTVLLNTAGRRFGDAEAGTSTLLHELGGHGVQGVEGFAPGGNFKDFTPKEIAKERARLQALDEGDDWGSIGTFDSSASDLDIARRLYRRLAGEVEARNVQTRQEMSAAERRRTPPWETQDVPDAEQIIRKR